MRLQKLTSQGTSFGPPSKTNCSSLKILTWGRNSAPMIADPPRDFDVAFCGEAHPMYQPSTGLDSHHPWNISFSWVPRQLLLLPPLLPPYEIKVEKLVYDVGGK